MSAIVQILGLAFIGLAGVIHIGIFLLESVLWRPRKTWRQFGVANEADAEIARPWALNQGYYNLFLAVGAIAGAIGGICGVTTATGWTRYTPLSDASFAWIPSSGAWGAVGAFSALCMVGAAVVLIVSSRGALLRGALIQGLAPLVGLALLGAGLLAPA
ncbi:MAG: DUF1304 domain-containing protein [Microbacteriaceae bacterium]|nr:DUF1304 domain-containing protein [Microbacteriaceae bacterium]